jgi:transposase
LRVPAPGQAKKVAMIGSLDYAELKSSPPPAPSAAPTSSHICNSSTASMVRSRARRSSRSSSYSTAARSHLSKAALAALAERAHWLTVEWPPKYAPELNDIEVVWGDLKARHLAHQTFTDPDVLDDTIHSAVAASNLQRNRIPLAKQRISA